MYNLNVKDLCMVYSLPNGDTVNALNHITLDIPAGQLLTILGPSGCGKTTLINILAGFLEQTSGIATLEGKEIAGPSPERGMVFQQGALFEWMSVKQNVGFGPTMSHMPKEKIDEITNYWLKIVGLGEFGDKAVYELSGGMQQRVALARCLANDPSLILMDEPLGALDALTREKMQMLILKLWEETGKTIILITHSVEEAMMLGDRLLVMAPRPGRIEKVYDLPFAKDALKDSARAIKQRPDFIKIREEILNMIWEMEDEIMGNAGEVENA